MNKLRTAIIAVSFLALTAASALEATVVSTKGKTEFQNRGETNWQALAIGTTLSKGAVISTGFKSQLVLKINESVITVSPLTRMTIEQLVAKPKKDETRVFLNTGSIKADVKHTQDRRTGFTVRSPVATASVRGTILGVSEGYKKTDVSCGRGSVQVTQGTGNAVPNIASDEDDSAKNDENQQDAVPSSVPGGSLIGQNQTTSFNNSGEQTSAQSNAGRNATNVGSAPERAASTENESMGGDTAGPASGNGLPQNQASNATTSVKVKVTLE